jgi:hypothetical protein
MSAKQTMFDIVKFTFMINLAIGFLFMVFPEFSEVGTGLKYNESQSDSFTTGMSNDLDPEGVLQDSSAASDRIFDMINLGMIQKIATAIKHYLYGVVDLLDLIVGGFMAENVHTFLFGFPLGIFYTMLNIGYIFAIWSLWTGQEE